MSRRWRRSAEDRQRTEDDRAALEARIAAAIREDAHARGAHSRTFDPLCPACNPAESRVLTKYSSELVNK